MHRSEIRDRFTLDAQGPGCGPQLYERRNCPMKKLMKNVVEYFAQYGDLINDWNKMI